eukprot:gene25124-biopygen4477
MSPHEAFMSPHEAFMSPHETFMDGIQRYSSAHEAFVEHTTFDCLVIVRAATQNIRASHVRCTSRFPQTRPSLGRV